MTSATSEGAQGISSKITFLKSVCSKEKDEVCHSFLVKKSKIAQIYNYDPQSAGINVQSPKSESTPRRLTLMIIVAQIYQELERVLDSTSR